jgi:hypothetical protein
MRTIVITLAVAAALALGAAPAGATVLAASGSSDTAQGVDPTPFWGSIDCEDTSRHAFVATGGDPHGTATGVPQGNSAFRRLTVVDGDDVWGERCELGQNDRRNSPVAVYREGMHVITYISFRLPSGFPLYENTWQAVMQMKQTGPSANSSGTPVLELDAWGGYWRLRQSISRRFALDSRELWSAPARTDVWTRFAFDVTYSRKKSRGRIQVSADLDGDGTFSDPGEQSAMMQTYTLKTEIKGGSRDGLKPGRSITSHLRTGLYHDQDISCPAGCSVDVDNVQIVPAG